MSSILNPDITTLEPIILLYFYCTFAHILGKKLRRKNMNERKIDKDEQHYLLRNNYYPYFDVGVSLSNLTESEIKRPCCCWNVFSKLGLCRAYCHYIDVKCVFMCVREREREKEIEKER